MNTSWLSTIPFNVVRDAEHTSVFIMAAVNRRPALAARTAGLQLPPFLDGKERATGRSVSAKRTRSPERAGDQSARNGNPKRARSSTTTVTRPAADALGKRRKSASQTVKDEKFSAAYGKAFPNFVFYFDIDSADAESAALRKILESRVCQLGAVRVHRPYFLTQWPHTSHCLEDGGFFLSYYYAPYYLRKRFCKQFHRQQGECTHPGTSIQASKWQEPSQELVCPCHFGSCLVISSLAQETRGARHPNSFIQPR